MQVESALATQNLKPTIDAIKRLYVDDKDKVQRETSALYKKSGVNPTAGAGFFFFFFFFFFLAPARSRVQTPLLPLADFARKQGGGACGNQ